MKPAWPLDLVDRALLGFAVVVGPLLALSPSVPRAVLTVVLIGLAPGYALVRPMRLGDNLVVLVATVATSLGVATLASTVLFYCRLWSWPLCAGVLVLITAGAVLIDAARRSPA